jgi:putative endonuclease
VKQGFVYIMTNRKDGVLYIGVTSDLAKRNYEHGSHAVNGFTKRYNLDKLVYYQVFDDINEAIVHEKRLKKYLRHAKIALIERMNPEWNNLTETIFA